MTNTQRLVENVISALLFLPVVNQYDWLENLCFHRVDVAAAAGSSQNLVFVCGLLGAMRLIGVVMVSSATLIVTVTWYRFLVREVRWHPAILGGIGACQMGLLVLSHAGNWDLLRCGVGGSAMVSVCVMLVAENRRKLDFRPAAFKWLIAGLTLVVVVLEEAIPRS